jgi:hypothetical protein
VPVPEPVPEPAPPARRAEPAHPAGGPWQLLEQLRRETAFQRMRELLRTIEPEVSRWPEEARAELCELALGRRLFLDTLRARLGGLELAHEEGTDHWAADHAAFAYEVAVKAFARHPQYHGPLSDLLLDLVRSADATERQTARRILDYPALPGLPEQIWGTLYRDAAGWSGPVYPPDHTGEREPPAPRESSSAPREPEPPPRAAPDEEHPGAADSPASASAARGVFAAGEGRDTNYQLFALMLLAMLLAGVALIIILIGS